MKPRERLSAILNGRMPDDRLPMIEWAAWWDKTMDRWKQEGMPAGLSWVQSLQYFGLDELHSISAVPDVPPAPSHGAAVIDGEAGYEALRERLYAPAAIERLLKSAAQLKERHDAGELSIRVWLDGFFWYPRRLFGIEPHLYAFYDQPELMHRINRELLAFNLAAVEELFSVLKPDFIGMAEDMSYNYGPMLSRQLFTEFLLPYYRKLTGYCKSRQVPVLTDSDGDITVMVPWLLEAGIDGVYPLERQAGVDMALIRRDYPEFIMMGGYDKMVMSRGEAAMRAEFDRILPVMRSGRYIPSVDHQTPPGVSLDNYRIYIGLFREYCEKAVKNG
ncbi:MAG: hypothetical protein LBO76_02815 [Treponema sp.]|jgi:hypothetical protein|nr:hypothetical protein [Treponema sp.]